MEERFVEVPGGRIFTLQWGEGPALIFCHATGMCARVYRQLLEPLAARHRIIAPDARGHGRTEHPADPAEIPSDWRLYGQDLLALVKALGGGPVRLAGHSFGATVAFETAVANPGLASSVLLIDPPFIPFAQAAAYRAHRDGGGTPLNPMADQAIRRRGHFPSLEAARRAYRHRGVFHDWPDEVLEDYLAGALLPEGDGVRLACTPQWEATSFRGVTTTLEDSMRAARFPFTLLAAGQGSTVGAEDEATIRALRPGAHVERIPGAGHFLAVTHPDLVRQHLLAMP